jgi:hypothetical protein
MRPAWAAIAKLTASRAEWNAKMKLQGRNKVGRDGQGKKGRQRLSAMPALSHWLS